MNFISLTPAQQDTISRLPPKRSSWRFLRDCHSMMLVTAPVDYALVLPLILLDVFVTIYQAIVFPVYGIEKVRRDEFIVQDRHLLPYLNTIEKINCLYCGYANGIVCYSREIASRSEANWCPINHANHDENSHPRHASFAERGDTDAFEEFRSR